MNKYKNVSELIDAFLNGETSAFSGTSIVRSNTRIISNQLLHYSTPILERGNPLIFNETRYSIQTDRLQKLIREKLTGMDYISAKNIVMDYCGPLSRFAL